MTNAPEFVIQLRHETESHACPMSGRTPIYSARERVISALRHSVTRSGALLGAMTYLTLTCPSLMR
eukprot:5078548-Lingulodinium_polyedra.AAC.1